MPFFPRVLLAYSLKFKSTIEFFVSIVEDGRQSGDEQSRQRAPRRRTLDDVGPRRRLPGHSRTENARAQGTAVRRDAALRTKVLAE